MKKKLLAAVLTGMMITSMMPVMAFANTESPSSQTEHPAVETGEEGTVQNGWSDDGKSYYKDGVLIKNEILKDGENIYYFDKNGIMVRGKSVKLKGKYYLFKDNGTRAGKGWNHAGGNEYYVKSSSGVVQTGWKAFSESAYYFKQNGKMAKNTKVGYLKIPKSGKLGEAYARGIKVLNKNGWKLRSAYNYAAKTKYANRKMRKKNSEDYAVYGFKNRKGNCYVMAAQFYVMAKLMGYDVHQVKGRVDLPHSWTEIKQKGKVYVYDPNFTNETGRNGYKIWYGKRGTWRYNHYKRMN